eukprot:scaffold19531_cov106-Cylindrotheca_fusiformis.AAC.1
MNWGRKSDASHTVTLPAFFEDQISGGGDITMTSRSSSTKCNLPGGLLVATIAGTSTSTTTTTRLFLVVQTEVSHSSYPATRKVVYYYYYCY